MLKWDWRREDSAYAVATVVAAALVCYLIAGNFGLVPSPFGPRAGGSLPVPAAAAVARSLDSPPPTATPTASTGLQSPPTSPTPADRTAPSATITSPEGPVVSATEGAQISGAASDADSGVDRVVVTFTPGSGEPTDVPADVHCDDAARRHCTWTADVPGVAGSYEVTARATDRSGNSAGDGPTSMTVINLGSVVEDLPDTAVDELIALLPGLLN